MEKVLIAYYSKTGSTKDTGEYIKKTLEKDYIVDIKEINAIKDFQGYSKIILGAPINGMQIVPQMKNFIEKHHESLRMIPNYFYALTYAYNHGRKFVKKGIDKDLKNLTSPIQSKVFVIGGVADKPMPKPMAFIFGLKSDEPLDNRDFSVVDKLIENIKN